MAPIPLAAHAVNQQAQAPAPGSGIGPSEGVRLVPKLVGLARLAPAAALGRAYTARRKKAAESPPKNCPLGTSAWRRSAASPGVVPQQPRAVSPVAPPALGAAGGCGSGGAAVPSAKSNCTSAMAPALDLIQRKN
jgi:hypothetical protein